MCADFKLNKNIMKIKLINNFSIAMIAMNLIACSVGPTAKLADGTMVTLGVDALTEGENDSRQATMPNGTKLSWVRGKYNQTSVAKTGISAYVLTKAIAGGVSAIRSNNATKVKVSQSDNALKTAQSDNALKTVQSNNATQVSTTSINADTVSPTP